MGKTTLLEEFSCQLFISDVDGVLTDGKIYLGPQEELFKVFNARDGLGIVKALQKGLSIALITGRESEITAKRAQELGIKYVYQNIQDKAPVVRGLCHEIGVSLDRTAYIGDDLNDLPALKIVGLPLAVRDAASEVKTVATYVTQNRGGEGAVREVLNKLCL